MGWFKNMIEKTMVNIIKANPQTYTINQTSDVNSNFYKNKVWYRGDKDELMQLYRQLPNSEQSFWGSVSSAGMEIKKTHIGLPNLIVNTLTDIVITDFNGIKIDDATKQDIWDKIAKENEFEEQLKDIIGDDLGIGDGAIKINYEANSEYPILEWVSGERVDFKYNRGKLREIVFTTIYEKPNNKSYELKETYGYGFISYSLTLDDKNVALTEIEETKDLKPITFDDKVIWAIPFIISKSNKFKGRGRAIYETKLDNFDSLDEICSQWIEAVRAGRAKTYIPESLIPKDPRNGDLLIPNSFDNKFIKVASDMGENADNKITTDQPVIPTDNYLQSYMTFLDLCLQGIISPSTLGIDMKKLDNAEAQREKEKTTLYSRNSIIEALNSFLGKLVNTVLKSLEQVNGGVPSEDIEVTVDFGEYGNPSFEAQVETIGKAKTSGIMSIETIVDELYGDSKDDDWKKEEVARLKAEQGIVEMGEEPALNNVLNDFENDSDVGGLNENMDNEDVV